MLTEVLPGIASGRSIAPLPDGRIVVGTDSELLVFAGGETTPTVTAPLGGTVRALAVSPGDTGVLAAVVGRGLVSVELGVLPGAAPLVADLVEEAQVAAVAVDPGARRAFAGLGRTVGRIVEFDLLAGTSTELLSALPSPIAIASDPASARLILAGRLGRLHQAGRVARVDLLSIDRADGQITYSGLAAALGSVVGLAFADAAHDALLIADAAGRLLHVDVVAGVPVAGSLRVLADGLEPVWAVAVTADGAVLLGSGDTVQRFDAPEVPEPVPAVSLVLADDDLYLGSWYRVGIELDGTVPFPALGFLVEPSDAGRVSVSQDASYADGSPSVLLCTGGLTGDAVLIAVDTTTGEKVADLRFSVTDAWTGTQGPPLTYFGEVNNAVPDGAWGGGDPYVPQNIDVHPALGQHRVALVIVETSDCPAATPAEVAALTAMLRAEAFDGVPDAGPIESARAFFERSSYGAFDLVDAGVVGPVRLPSPWTSYAPTAGARGDTSDLANFSRATVAEIRAQNRLRARVGAAPLVDLLTVQSIVLVIRSIAPNPPAVMGRYHWPMATRPGGAQYSFEIDSRPIWNSLGETTVPVNRTIQTLAMPSDWSARGSRAFRETLTHELAHNLGLPDEYALPFPRHTADAIARQVGQTSVGQSWTLMTFEDEFPELTVVEKMLLGWVRPDWVRPVSFSTTGPLDDDIVLHAVELGAPPPGRVSALEIRKGDGTNAYFEYRREQPARASDQDLPDDRVVLGTEFVSGDVPPMGRRNLLLVRNDADNDDGEFQVGDDYTEPDTSDPEYPNDFEMSVLQSTPEWARIHVSYGDQKPDPQIRPWAASTGWRSPDIEVRNSRGDARPAFRNVPWAGHPNTIVATMRNGGDLPAKDVRVDFFWKDFTFTEGAEHLLGSATVDLPLGVDVVVASPVPWTPPVFPFIGENGFTVTGHFCVGARIAEYAHDSVPVIREVTPANNMGQSNYNVVISSSASPSSREAQVLRMTNPYDRSVRIYPVVRQTSPLARVYLEAEWVELEPGAESSVAILTESLRGDPSFASLVRELGDHEQRTPSRLNITGVAETGDGCHGDTLGGASVITLSARATRFLEFFAGDGVAFGVVATVDTGDPVDGPVLLTLQRDGEEERTATGMVENGLFRMRLPEADDRNIGFAVVAHYLGDNDSAPCESELVEVVV